MHLSFNSSVAHEPVDCENRTIVLQNLSVLRKLKRVTSAEFAESNDNDLFWNASY